MFRIAATLVSVVCVAAVMTAIAAAAYLWYDGRLTGETVNDVVAIFDGEEEALPTEPEIPEEIAQVAKDEVVERRAMAILELTSRERELNLLKGLIESKAAQVVSEKRELERAQKNFQEKLTEVEKELLAESAEQARGILLALPPDEAVRKLMTLDADEAVRLMKGVADKAHAKILQEFQGQEETPRGNEIFQAIVRGQPKREVIQQAAEGADGG